MPAADDVALLRAAGSGEREAFDEFVGRHAAAVHRFLRASGASGADAEDALQESFISAWGAASSYRGGGSARAWILTIGRNALRRAHRRRVGEPSDFEDVDVLGLRAGWGNEDDLLEKIVRRETLQRALGALDAEDREVLVLRELEGFSGEEVAEVLGTTVGAMKSRLHRARLRFVAALGEVSRG